MKTFEQTLLKKIKWFLDLASRARNSWRSRSRIWFLVLTKRNWFVDNLLLLVLIQTFLMFDILLFIFLCFLGVSDEKQRLIILFSEHQEPHVSPCSDTTQLAPLSHHTLSLPTDHKTPTYHSPNTSISFTPKKHPRTAQGSPRRLMIMKWELKEQFL